MKKKIKLVSNLSPGDAVVMTAAINSLHTLYPDEYETAVETSAMEIWENNPFISKTDDSFEAKNLHYDWIHVCNQFGVSFMQAYVQGLSQLIQKPLHLTRNRPDLYLTEQEKTGWINQVREQKSHGKDIQFWLINAGIKNDYTAKQWPIEYYQEVVDKTAGRIQWCQVGAPEHDHHNLRGVINLVGKTNQREFIRLVYHSQGGLGPSTYLQHLCAAFEKPYICLLGGREPVPWVTYPKQHTLHTIGQLSCCLNEACWRSRVVPLADGDEKDKSLCDIPVLGMIKDVAKCMSMIRPEEVISIMQRYY